MMSDSPVLTGWKAIAAFLKRDQRTAMRWAAERGLPVRRVPGGKRGSVYAVPAEIAEWLARGARQPDETVERTPVEPSAPTAIKADDVKSNAGSDDAAPRPAARPSTTRWRVTVLAAALAGAAMAAGSIELGLSSVGSAAGGTMTGCRELIAGR